MPDVDNMEENINKLSVENAFYVANTRHVMLNQQNNKKILRYMSDFFSFSVAAYDYVYYDYTTMKNGSTFLIY